MRSQELRDEMKQLVADARKYTDSIETGKLSEAEAKEADQKATDALAKYDVKAEELKEIERQDARREQISKAEEHMAKSRGRSADPAAVVAPNADPADRLSIKCGDHTLRFDEGSVDAARMSSEYNAAFNSFLSGDSVRSGLVVADNSKGGYLAPMQMASQLIEKLDDMVFMRRISNVLPPIQNAASLGVVSIDTNPNDADWTPEVPASDITEDDAMRFGKREFHPHSLTKLVKISRKLLRSSMVDPQSVVRDRVAYKFAITEEKAFMTGSGANRPLGVFVASSEGISTGRDKAAASTSTFTADELIATKYNLKGQYQAKAEWIMHRTVLEIARKLKDGQGQYLWQPGIMSDGVERILSLPVNQSEYAPNTMTTGQYVAICGDFKQGYWIADALDVEIQILVEKFALTNQIGIVSRKNTDGMPVDEDAFSRLVLA